jgi:Rrf2 family iron-sulfur cluster assembly transcriptional regulator
MSLLPRKSVLAIAAVIDIAVHGRGRPVTAKILAQRYSLPARHLEPVLQALVRNGILRGIRGPRGGYELGRERSRITAENIVRRCRKRGDQRFFRRAIGPAQQCGDSRPGTRRARFFGRARPHHPR